MEVGIAGIMHIVHALLIDGLHNILKAADGDGWIGRRRGRLDTERKTGITRQGERGEWKILVTMCLDNLFIDMHVLKGDVHQAFPCEVVALELLKFAEGFHPLVASVGLVHNQTRPLVLQARELEIPTMVLLQNGIQFVVAALVEEHMALTLQGEGSLEIIELRILFIPRELRGDFEKRYILVGGGGGEVG